MPVRQLIRTVSSYSDPFSSPRRPFCAALPTVGRTSPVCGQKHTHPVNVNVYMRAAIAVIFRDCRKGVAVQLQPLFLSMRVSSARLQFSVAPGHNSIFLAITICNGLRSATTKSAEHNSLCRWQAVHCTVPRSRICAVRRSTTGPDRARLRRRRTWTVRTFCRPACRAT